MAQRSVMKAHQLLISSKYIHGLHQDAGGVAVPRSWNSSRNLGREPFVGFCEAEQFTPTLIIHLII